MQQQQKMNTQTNKQTNKNKARWNPNKINYKWQEQQGLLLGQVNP